MTTRERSEERKQFLTDLLITAVEHCGYGWFTSREYEPNGELGTAYAVIEESTARSGTSTTSTSTPSLGAWA